MITLSRDDIIRMRFCTNSAILALDAMPESQTPGTRQANEKHELASIMSRLIALIEATQDGAQFDVAPKKTGSVTDKQITKRLPGLGA